MKKIIKYIMMFILIIAIFIGILILCSLFPRTWIEENAKESANILNEEGIPSYMLGVKFDGSTDALMLDVLYSIDSEKPLESALLARVNYLPEKEQNLFHDINIESRVVLNEGHDAKKQLLDTVNNEISDSFEYARYWHGYISVFRPLLIFFNINEIRIIMISLLAMLAIILLMLLYKKLSFKYCLVILLSLIFSEYFLMGFTLQGIMTFIIAMIGSIIICMRFDKIKNIGLYFFVIGMLTCYFDLLTHPIVTLGIPMIIYLLMKQNKEPVSLKESIKLIIINSLLWGVGWICTNLSKWIIVDLIYDRNLIHKSLMQFGYRSQEKYNLSFSWEDGLISNLIYSFKNTCMYFTVLVLYAIYCLIKNYKNIKLNIKLSIPYLVISLMPIIWCLIMRNHTYDHAYFTWRGLIVFYMGLGIFLFKLLNGDNNCSIETKEGKQ